MRKVTISIPVPSMPHPRARLTETLAKRRMHHETRKLEKLNEDLDAYPVLRQFWDAHCRLQNFAMSDESPASLAANQHVVQATVSVVDYATMTEDPQFKKLARKIFEMVVEEDKARATAEEWAEIEKMTEREIAARHFIHPWGYTRV